MKGNNQTFWVYSNSHGFALSPSDGHHQIDSIVLAEQTRLVSMWKKRQQNTAERLGASFLLGECRHASSMK